MKRSYDDVRLAKMFVGGLAQSVDGAKLGAFFETRYNCVVSEVRFFFDIPEVRPLKSNGCL